MLELEEAVKLDRTHCGGGLLFQARTDRLLDIARWIGRRDQTMTYFGFSAEQLRQLAVSLNGRGIDRMAPIGQALNFHRYWDGYDLVAGIYPNGAHHRMNLEFRATHADELARREAVPQQDLWFT